MRLRYQQGCLRCIKRKSGPDRWEFLWRENDVAGKRVRRTVIIGTVEQYPTRDLAQAAVNGLRMQVNEDRYRQPGTSSLSRTWSITMCRRNSPGKLTGILMQRELCTRNFYGGGYVRIGAR
jgi:hypothetical protein